MSKSLGNTVDPFLLAERFGADSIRYFLLREAPFGSDFSYSEEKIAQRRNSDLANDLGNLLQRTLAMLARYRDGIVPERPPQPRSELAQRFAPLPALVRERIFDLRLREALEEVWELVTALNRTIDERKPWELHKRGQTKELDAVLYDLAEGLRWLAILLHPVMPERMGEMWQQLGAPGRIDEDWSSSLRAWGGLPPLTQTAPGRIPLSKARSRAASVIDTHCHVHDRKFDDDRDETIARARAAGVNAMLTVGEDIADSRRAIATAQRYGLTAAVGIHPHEAKDAPADIAGALRPAVGRAGRRCDRRDRARLLLRPQSARVPAKRTARATPARARGRAAGRLPPARCVRRFHGHPARRMASGDARSRALLHRERAASAGARRRVRSLARNRRRADLSERERICATQSAQSVPAASCSKPIAPISHPCRCAASATSRRSSRIRPQS